MKENLKTQLINLIRQKGYVSYPELEQACNSVKFGRMYKIDTARRRLDEVMTFGRFDYNPNIKADGKDEEGYIKGWKWVGEKPPMKTYRVLDPFGNVEKTLTIAQI